MTGMRVGPKDLRGIMAMMPAFATGDACDVDNRSTVDVDNLVAGVNRIIGDGIDVITTTGSFGEFFTLLPDEFETLARATVQAVDGRVPLFIGTTGLNTRDVIAKMELVQNVGADGVLVGIPFYFPLTTDNALRFVADIATRFPSLAIMLYHNPTLHHVTLPPAAFKQLIQHPNVIAMKDSHRDTAGFLELDRIVRDRISVFVHQSQYYPFAGLGAAGCWSIDVWMDPAPIVRLRDAIAVGDDETAQQIIIDLKSLSLGGGMSWRETAAKLAVRAAGYCDPGPLRPPFLEVPPDIERAAAQRAERWAELCSKWASPERLDDRAAAKSHPEGNTA